MAENQAEDEEDELFGDFKFVSSSNHSYLQQQQLEEEDEDDWGDFVDNFSNSNRHDVFNNSFMNGFFHGKNPSRTSENSGDLDPFAFFSDHSTEPLESQLNAVESEANSASMATEKRWEKPKGALPLSIFGDVEEEAAAIENPGLGGDDDAKKDLFSAKPTDSAKNGLSFGSGVGISDLLVNFYAQAVENQQIMIEKDPNSDPVDESGDFDEDDWEFQDAFNENNGTAESESGVKNDEAVLEIPVEAARATTTTTATTETSDGFIEVNGGMWGGSEGSAIASAFSDTEQLGVDWFVTSNGGSCHPDKVADDFHFESHGTTANGNGSSSDLFSQFDLIAIENGSNAFLNGGTHASEEFTTFDLLGQPKETSELANQSAVDMKDLMFDGKNQGNGKGMENHQDALPLPIFSNNKLDSSESLFNEDVFSYQAPNSLRNGINSQNLISNISFNDLISNLYSQAEHTPAVTATQEHNGVAHMDSNFNPVNGEADFDDGSWEFKDAFSETRVEKQSSVLDLGLEDMQKFSPEPGPVNFVDFYTKLKEESYFIALHHVDDLKKAQKTAALSGDDAKAVTLQDEVQAAYKKLGIDDVVSNEFCLKDHPTPDIYVTKLLEVMKEHKHQILESEYQLSKKISLAEKDLTSTIWLYEHSVSMVKILTLGSMEDQFSYTNSWSKMISACAQELKHGALIWNQSLEKSLHREILSKSKGQQYIVALGEIYRVVEVLRASAAVYKPWLLSSLVDATGIFASLEECDAAWLSSGLEEALQSTITYPFSIEYEGTPEALLQSIKSIHDLNTTALQNQIDSVQEPVCRLSLLSLRFLPDMKTGTWNGEQYFLTLANLWANCVSRDLPMLAHIQFGS